MSRSEAEKENEETLVDTTVMANRSGFHYLFLKQEILRAIDDLGFDQPPDGMNIDFFEITISLKTKLIIYIFLFISYSCRKMFITCFDRKKY